MKLLLQQQQTFSSDRMDIHWGPSIELLHNRYERIGSESGHRKLHSCWMMGFADGFLRSSFCCRHFWDRERERAGSVVAEGRSLGGGDGCHGVSIELPINGIRNKRAPESIQSDSEWESECRSNRNGNPNAEAIRMGIRMQKQSERESESRTNPNRNPKSHLGSEERKEEWGHCWILQCHKDAERRGFRVEG
jgi:hypothetical protein